MPAPAIKDFAKKSGKSEKEVEKLWNDAKEIASDELGKKEKDFGDKEWSYVTGVLKKMLKIKEDTSKRFIDSEESISEFLEKRTEGYMKMKAMDMGLSYDDYDEDELALGSDYTQGGSFYNEPITDPNAGKEELEDETMTSMNFANTITGPITPPKEKEYDEEFFSNIDKSGSYENPSDSIFSNIPEEEMEPAFDDGDGYPPVVEPMVTEEEEEYEVDLFPSTDSYFDTIDIDDVEDMAPPLEYDTMSYDEKEQYHMMMANKCKEMSQKGNN